MTKKETLKKLEELIKSGEPVIYINLINCGLYGPAIIKRLEDAGYTTEDKGHPQPRYKK